MESKLKCLGCNKKYIKEYFYIRKYKKYGCINYCKSCRHLNYRYNISYKDYLDILRKQKNKCAICLEKKKEHYSIDHDHRTGKLRGLLCRNCNSGLGFFKDNSLILYSAIKYLNATNTSD